MPYGKIEREGTWYVHKLGDGGSPEGKALGTHDEESKADAQLRALNAAYADESKSPTLKGDISTAGSLGFGVADDEAKKSRVLVKSSQTEGTIEAVLYRVRDDEGNVTVCESGEIERLAKPAVKVMPVNVSVRIRFLLTKGRAGQPILRSDISHLKGLMLETIERLGIGGRVAFALAQRKIANAYDLFGRGTSSDDPDVQRQVMGLLGQALQAIQMTVPPAYRSTSVKAEQSEITRRKLLIDLRNRIDLARRRMRQEPHLMAAASVNAKIASESSVFPESTSLTLRRIATKIEAAMVIAAKDPAKAASLLQSAMALTDVAGGINDSFVTVRSMTPGAKAAINELVMAVSPLTTNAIKSAADVTPVYDALERLEDELADTPEADAALKALQDATYNAETNDAKAWAAAILEKARPFTGGVE